MKIYIPQTDEVFSFDEGYVNTLIIEKQNVFREVIEDIKIQIDGEKGASILSEKDVPVSFSGICEVISDFACFDISKKNLVNAMITSLGKTALNESFFMDTQILMAQIENYMQNLSSEIGYNTYFTKLSPLSLIKSVGIEIKNDYDNPLERVIDYIELSEQFAKIKLFITVNMRSFFEDDDMQLFVDTVISHGFKVFMIENLSHPKLKNEKRLTVDKDFCIF